MQIPEPTSEHQFLLQLVGDWDFECEYSMGPDQPSMVSKGHQTTRALGSLWTLGEMESPTPGDTPMRSLMTVGYDPARQLFVGSFVASCMTHQWLYEGSLDADRKLLTLNAEGPSFADDGTMTMYQDMIEVIDENSYILSSQYRNSAGAWVPFMRSQYRRRM